MDKLELKHIVPYLPHELKLYHKGHKAMNILERDIPTGIYDRTMNSINLLSVLKKDPDLKPILTPLSELVGKFGLPAAIEDYLRGKNYKRTIDLPYWAVDYLCGANQNRDHFDVFGLIDKGLAIDSNTI